MLAGVPLPETSAMASAQRPPVERDEVVVVAAHLVAGAARAPPPRSRRWRAGRAGTGSLDLARDLHLAVAAAASRGCTRCRRTVSRAASACRASVCANSRSSSVKGAPDTRSPTARKPVGARAHGERHDQRHARARAGAPGARPSGSSATGERPRRASSTAARASASGTRRSPSSAAQAALVRERQPAGHRRGTARSARPAGAPSACVVTRFLMLSSSKLEVSSRLMSNRLWSWNTFTESRWFTVAQLVVDEAVLDGRGGAGGHAAQEAGLLRAVGRAVRARPRPSTRSARGGSARPRAVVSTIGHSTSRPNAARGRRRAAPARGTTSLVAGARRWPRAAGAPGGQAARRPQRRRRRRSPARAGSRGPPAARPSR